MNSVRVDSRRIGAGVAAFLLLACVALDAGLFWLLRSFSARLAVHAQNPESLNQMAAQLLEGFWFYFVPASFIFFGLLALWVGLRVRRALTRAAAPEEPSRSAGRPKPSLTQPSAEQAAYNQRLFLHLLTVLQREGRIVDFFFENLADYSDAQIGTAVRSIHENCRNVVDKYLAPQAVVSENEGDPITVEKDFDPSALKLTGNVIGEPPFRGTVRHRGWRVRRLELPTLSGRPDPGIIAPAEVEIL